MSEDARTASEIASLIKACAATSLGPRPRDLQICIFGESPEWRCSLSPATQASNFEYRDGVLGVAKELQRTVKLTRRQEQDPH
jgi:hypothetical protein